MYGVKEGDRILQSQYFKKNFIFSEFESNLFK